jgi:hypothetical protein
MGMPGVEEDSAPTPFRSLPCHAIRRAMTAPTPKDPPFVDYRPGELDAVHDFIRQMRYRFPTQRMVRVWPDRIEVFDVNCDAYEIRGLGYSHADVVSVLDAVNAVYRKDVIHEPISLPYKEFKTGKRYTWANDRVM